MQKQTDNTQDKQVSSASKIIQNELSDILANFDIKSLLNHHAEAVVISGSVDREEIKTDKDHARAIAKCIFAITLERASRQYRPLSDQYRKEFKNLDHFI